MKNENQLSKDVDGQREITRPERIRSEGKNQLRLSAEPEAVKMLQERVRGKIPMTTDNVPVLGVLIAREEEMFARKCHEALDAPLENIVSALHDHRVVVSGLPHTSRTSLRVGYLLPVKGHGTSGMVRELFYATKGHSGGRVASIMVKSRLVPGTTVPGSSGGQTTISERKAGISKDLFPREMEKIALIGEVLGTHPHLMEVIGSVIADRERNAYLGFKKAGDFSGYDLFKQPGMTEDVVRTVLDKIKMGVDRMTECGLGHGDLTLRNVMIHGKTFDPRIIDYGSAVSLTSPEPSTEALRKIHDLNRREDSITSTDIIYKLGFGKPDSPAGLELYKGMKERKFVAAYDRLALFSMIVRANKEMQANGIPISPTFDRLTDQAFAGYMSETAQEIDEKYAQLDLKTA